MMDTFNHGYTKALLDVQRFFENHSDSLSYSKLYNRSGIEAVLKCLIENREEMRETGDIADLVCKKEKKRVILAKMKAGDSE